MTTRENPTFSTGCSHGECSAAAARLESTSEQVGSVCGSWRCLSGAVRRYGGPGCLLRDADAGSLSSGDLARATPSDAAHSAISGPAHYVRRGALHR